MFRMLKLILTTICMGFLLLGCHAQQQEVPSSNSENISITTKSGKTVSASLTGYNHTDKTIVAFYVNGEWGGNITPGTGGGSFVCCVDLPDPWRTNYSVTITWEDHELKTRKREVPVPKYEPQTIAGLKVHFLRNGEIKVFAGPVYLGHPDYPLKGKESELKPGVPIEIVHDIK